MMMRQNQAKAFSMSIRYFINNKKHGDAVLFCVHRMLWLSAPNPDARNFSRKVSWNFKSFAKMKWCIRCEVLLPTFLRKKSRSDYVVVPFIGDVAVSSCLFLEDVSYF